MYLRGIFRLPQPKVPFLEQSNRCANTQPSKTDSVLWKQATENKHKQTRETIDENERGRGHPACSLDEEFHGCKTVNTFFCRILRESKHNFSVDIMRNRKVVTQRNGAKELDRKLNLFNRTEEFVQQVNVMWDDDYVVI